MSPGPLARLASMTLVLVLFAASCGALESPESDWVADEDSVAERRVADELAAARERLAGLMGQVGSIGPEKATCVIDGLVDARTDDAVHDLLDPETVSTSLQGPTASALLECDPGDAVAIRWIPELGVELRAQVAARDCVADAARPWVADRFAEVVALGGLGEEESLVDPAWLATTVDRCDAGAAMMTAAAVLHPQVGADARTPSRWYCAAAAAPAGAFDPLLDPSVTTDEERAARLEARIAPYFAGCA